jgi:hypothetical protein
MFRNEYILGDQRAAAGAAQPGDVPIVLDGNVAARHQEVGFVDHLAFVVKDRGTEKKPVRVLAARPERPEAIEGVPALGGLSLPAW